MNREYIESKRGTVMDAIEFQIFVTSIWEALDFNYTAAAEWIGEGASSATIRRVIVDDVDSEALRKVLDIRKSDRTRY
jgi:hypothetical protein